VGYSTVLHIERGSEGDVEAKVVAYLGTIADTKKILGFSGVPYGSDEIMIVILHEA
jgi:hypothetical protein